MTPLPEKTLRGSLVMVALVATLAAAGCGSSAAPAGSSNSSNSARTPTPTAGQAASGGVADTPSNPDRSYMCADATTNGSGQTITYTTVAGTDASSGQSECSTLAQVSGWTAVSSSPFHENLYTPVCFITFDTGRLTARVYTSDTASFADGVGVCNSILQRFSLATLPPS